MRRARNKTAYVKKAGCVLLGAVLLFCCLLPGVSAKSRFASRIEETHAGLAARIGAPLLSSPETLPTASAAGADWIALALARYSLRSEEGTDFLLPEDYGVYADAETDVLARRAGEDGFGPTAKLTDYYRMILTLRALGKPADPALVRRCTSELTVPLKRLNVITLSFLLLCWEDSPDAVLEKETVIDALIACRTSNLGWSLQPTGYADPDVTAMALTALSFCLDYAPAREAADAAVALLSRMQGADGGYASYGKKNAESSAQVILALCSLGIDPETDPRFLKNGRSPADALDAFRLPDGTYAHALPADPENPAAGEGTYNGMATEQALLALVSLWRLSQGLPALYSAEPDPAPKGAEPLLARLTEFFQALFRLLRQFSAMTK